MEGQDMTDYTELVEALRYCSATKGMAYCNVNCKYGWKERSKGCKDLLMTDAADAIEELQAKVKRLQDKLCDWCAVCPKERRRPEDCELLSETPVMYGPSDAAKMEVQDDRK